VKRRLQPDDVLARAADVQLADLPGGRTPGGRLLARHARGLTVVDGVARADAEAVAAEVDGRRTAEEVVDALAGRYPTREAVRLLRRLDGVLFHRAAPIVSGRVLVLANGAAGPRLVGELTRQGLDARLGGLGGGADVVVVAIEDTPYRRLFELQADCLAAGVTSLWVTFDADGARVGPSVVAGQTPCFGCAQRVCFGVLGLDDLDAIGDLRTLECDEAAWPALRAAAAEARRLLAGEGELLARVVRLSPAGTSAADVAPHGACRLGCCAASSTPAAAGVLERQPLAATPAGELVTSVGILGGGTAGYLTALALRRKLPELKVTLVESSAVPIIGVGEATTPLMPQFLHADLGIPARELFAAVRPTLKLGIRFFWGEGDFGYPFGPVRPLDAYVHDGDVRNCSLAAMWMAAGRVPADPRSFGTEVAYHLDNARFVRFLHQKARDAGVAIVDATVADAVVAEDGEDVRELVTDDGRRLAFDLYVDASGFRSLLLEKALGSPFVSFAGSLFNDRAWVATVPREGTVRPYTTATAMDAGWCWSTPQLDEDHRGYVFASAFIDSDAARDEMRQKNPGMGAPRLVTFRAGRHACFWRGNVVALGNAYGFVEPLESTALHMLVRQIGLLLSAFPLRRGERGVQGLLNRKVNGAWDYLRWFLALHYKFNRAMDTRFWRACREDVDVSAHGELLAAFAERGPLSYDRAARRHFDYPDPLWGPEGIDVVLLGQRAASRLPRPSVGREDWRRRVELCRRIVERSPRQEETLARWAEEPEWLDRLEAAFLAAGPAFSSEPVSLPACSGADARGIMP